MAAIPMLQLATVEKLHPFDAQFPKVALRGIAITLIAGTVAMLVDLLPDWFSLPLLLLTAMASIWLSLRFSLPLADRMSLGKTGRKLLLPSPIFRQSSCRAFSERRQIGFGRFRRQWRHPEWPDKRPPIPMPEKKVSSRYAHASRSDPSPHRHAAPAVWAQAASMQGRL